MTSNRKLAQYGSNLKLLIRFRSSPPRTNQNFFTFFNFLAQICFSAFFGAALGCRLIVSVLWYRNYFEDFEARTPAEGENFFSIDFWWAISGTYSIWRLEEFFSTAHITRIIPPIISRKHESTLRLVYARIMIVYKKNDSIAVKLRHQHHTFSIITRHQLAGYKNETSYWKPFDYWNQTWRTYFNVKIVRFAFTSPVRVSEKYNSIYQTSQRSVIKVNWKMQHRRHKNELHLSNHLFLTCCGKISLREATGSNLWTFFPSKFSKDYARPVNRVFNLADGWW